MANYYFLVKTFIFIYELRYLKNAKKYSSIIGAGTGTMGSRDVITENNREKFLLLIARGHRKLIAL